MNYKAIIFDLDGTLLNSLEDISDSLNTVLMRYSLPAHSIQDYRRFIGDGAKQLIQRALPSDLHQEEFIKQILSEYSVEYRNHCMDKTYIYTGIVELIEALRERGIRMNVLSNKPDEFTKMICTHYFGSNVFEQIAGQRDDVPKKPDPAGALKIIKSIGLQPADFIYLGDSAVDVQTAHRAQICVVAATWGFRDREELLTQNPDYIIDSPTELLNIPGIK